MTAAALRPRQREDLARGAQGEHLPLHRLRVDPRCHRSKAKNNYPERSVSFASPGHFSPSPARPSPAWPDPDWAPGARAGRAGRGHRPGPVHRRPGGRRRRRRCGRPAARAAAAYEAGALAARARVDPVDRRVGGAGGRGVVAVLSYADSPRTLFSSARHHDPDDDPYDTLVLDRTVRFHGQRVAAVVAETIGAAEAACALISVDYEVRPAVTDPASALADGAPLLHPERSPPGQRLRRGAPARPATSPPGSRRPTGLRRHATGPSGCSTSRSRRT